MGRAPRAAVAGLVYHALNRANARHPLLAAPADYAAFEQVLAEARDGGSGLAAGLAHKRVFPGLRAALSK
jgi:hypothetical protein